MDAVDAPPVSSADPDGQADSLRVLNIVTTPDTRFFQQQVRSLSERGVHADTVSVPDDHRIDSGEVADRSFVDYVRFVPKVVRASFGEYDLLHANFGLTAPAALAQPNLPVVLSLWGTDLMGSYGWVSKFCATQVDAVVVMSEEMASLLPVDPVVIPHGVDLDRFRPLPRGYAREVLGWRPEGYHVLFPYPEDRRVKNYPRAKRVAERASEALGQSVTVQTIAGVPHDQMVYYYNAADCLLLTSEREGSPNSVKEAMACNVPVVSTDVGDVRERLADVSSSYVRDTDDGLVDAVVAALSSSGRSDGREAAREITHERTAERLEAVYRRVLAE